jgi:Protein of unknown function (DUF2934)
MTAMPPRNFDPLRFCVPPRVTTEERRRWIATAAYFKAQQRGFIPGHEASDWRAAEAEFDAGMTHRY